MYHYAINVSEKTVLNPTWRNAAEKSKIRHIELDGDVEATPEERAKELEILQELQASGALTCTSFHLPWGWHYYSPDEADRKQSVRDVIEFMKPFRCLKAKHVTMHSSGEPVSEDPAVRHQFIEALRRSLTDLLPVFEDWGVSVNLEILPRSCIGRIPEELLEAVDGFPMDRVGICFDVNHLCGCPEKLPAYLKQVAPRLRTCHLSDYDGKDECHWYPGLGVIDWCAVMDVIKSIDHDLLLIFETGNFVKVPQWQPRVLEQEIIFRNGENNAFFLENCKEIRERQKAFRME